MRFHFLRVFIMIIKINAIRCLTSRNPLITIKLSLAKENFMVINGQV